MFVNHNTIFYSINNYFQEIIRNIFTPCREEIVPTTDRDDDKLGSIGSHRNTTYKNDDEGDDNQNIDYKYPNDNATNLHIESPPKTLDYEKEETGSPLNEKENEVSKVRSTETGMTHSGQQQTSAKNQTCDRGVWSWQDERIFLQVLYSIMNSYNNNSMNIYQGGMLNIKSNDGSEDVCSNNDGGLMQNNEFDVCRVKSVERYASFPKHQKQMYDMKIRMSNEREDYSDSLEEPQGNDRGTPEHDENVAVNGHSSDGGKDKTIPSTGGGIKHGGQTNVMSEPKIDKYGVKFLK